MNLIENPVISKAWETLSESGLERVTQSVGLLGQFLSQNKIRPSDKQL